MLSIMYDVNTERSSLDLDPKKFLEDKNSVAGSVSDVGSIFACLEHSESCPCLEDRQFALQEDAHCTTLVLPRRKKLYLSIANL